MKAMIFAAGLGTRLKPITDTIPKALVPIAGVPLIEHTVLKLKSAGFSDIIVNVHHFADQIIDFFKKKNNFGINIVISDERNRLLNTGGGIAYAADFFRGEKAFLVHNVDILSNIDLNALCQCHLKNDSLATLVVNNRETARYLLFDDELCMKGWTNIESKELRPSSLKSAEAYRKLAFSGIQVLSSDVFELMKNYGELFSIMDFYISESLSHPIRAFIPEKYEMIDVGKINVLAEAEKFLTKKD